RPSPAAATAVDPNPPNGSSTVSPQKLNSLTKRRGISTGKGAGCSGSLTFGMRHTVLVNSRHSSLLTWLRSFCSVVGRMTIHLYWREAEGVERAARFDPSIE